MTDQPVLDTPENWDAASEGYATKIAPKMMAGFVDDFLDLLELSLEHEVLEVACGSGILTKSLCTKVKHLLAIDFSPKMLELCQKSNSAATNIQYREMNGQSLDLPDNTFDRTACMFAIMLFSDRKQGFKEQFRVLKPGGKSFFSAWAGPEQFQLFGLFLSTLQKAFPEMPRPETPPPALSLADLSRFQSEMEAAGFQRVETKTVTKELVLENFDALWAMVTTGAPPIRLLLDRVGPAGQAKLKETLREIVKEKFGSAPIRLSNSATVGVGWKSK